MVSLRVKNDFNKETKASQIAINLKEVGVSIKWDFSADKAKHSH